MPMYVAYILVKNEIKFQAALQILSPRAYLAYILIQVFFTFPSCFHS